MGPSGSGKTTLLDLLAGRKNAGTIDGTVAFAGQKPTPAFLRRYTGAKNHQHQPLTLPSQAHTMHA
jgi:ABC-type multidrug transport system ATPase subunit